MNGIVDEYEYGCGDVTQRQRALAGSLLGIKLR